MASQGAHRVRNTRGERSNPTGAKRPPSSSGISITQITTDVCQTWFWRVPSPTLRPACRRRCVWTWNDAAIRICCQATEEANAKKTALGTAAVTTFYSLSSAPRSQLLFSLTPLPFHKTEHRRNKHAQTWCRHLVQQPSLCCKVAFLVILLRSDTCRNCRSTVFPS